MSPPRQATPNNERSPLLSAATNPNRRRDVDPVTGRFAFADSSASLVAAAAAGLLFLLASFLAYEYGTASAPSVPPALSNAKVPRRHGNDRLRPGEVFLDTDGDPVNAHGGGFLFHDDTYYWYGEIKIGPTTLPESNAAWGGTRVDLSGISCYSSRDLLNWDYEGVALSASSDPSHDLYKDNVAERPKVVYNNATGKYVMWLHVDSADYRRARCGVATSDRPEGPFAYRGSFRPDGEMARDLTVFVDDDARAYLLTSSEDNAAIHVSELTEDYLSTTGNYTRIFVGRYTEAPAVFKRRGRYYLVGSGCTAWRPNAARSAWAPSMMGPWTDLGNPCRGEGANTTFRSQSTYVLHVPVRGGEGDEANFVFMADRWNENNLSDSRYVWLPLTFDEEEHVPNVKWRDEWSPALVVDAWPT
ncbi:hypothetical protein ACHAWF_012352 [Thalassiosira exigua]